MEINISDILEPEGKHRALCVTKVTDSRVDDLITVLIQQRNATLTLELTVLKTPKGKHVLLHGNHCYRAMLKIRTLSDTSNWFQLVCCRLYGLLTTQEALAVGFG